MMEGNIIKKYLFVMMLAFGMAAMAPFPATTVLSTASLLGYQQVQAAESASNGMKRVTLIIRKLREAMGSMKDFDELEKAGLRKKDVDRMRRAMNAKIQQMMEDAIYAIRAL